jgi:hypothetical protein
MRKKSWLLALLFSSQCFAEVPSQFIARQYTEGLGRAPDAAGWQRASNRALADSCSAKSLQALALSVFQSAEYRSKDYLPEEQVLTVYRAVLAREPERGEFDAWVGKIKSGTTLATLVQSLVATAEFTSLKDRICAGTHYESAHKNPPLNIGLGIGAATWTQAQLESCLARNSVCSIPPRTVVALTSTLTIPAGKVLETAGGIERRMYARQARLVRSGTKPGMLIVMQPGSTVRNVWVDGGRDRFDRKTLPRDPNPIDDVYPNINYIGGDDGVIRGVRSDAPLSGTHIQTYPYPFPSLTAPASVYAGSVSIDDNLTTGYAHSHYSDGTPIPWADGISNHISRAKITNNDIVDPTDVGIVLFTHNNDRQASTASNNVIVHAGHSAYGSLGFDAHNCTAVPRTACNFSGRGFTDNLIFAGRTQHADIMLFNGTGAWETSDRATTCSGANHYNCGTGGQMSGNKTILGDRNQRVQVQAGLVVDGMLNAITSRNNLNVIPMTQPVDRPTAAEVRLACARNGKMILNAVSAGHASGTLQAGADVDSDVNVGCIGH